MKTTLVAAILVAVGLINAPATAAAAQLHLARERSAVEPLLQFRAASTSVNRIGQWSRLMARHRAETRRRMPCQNGLCQDPWRQALQVLRAGPAATLTERVNSYVNRARYVSDQSNWGRSDHWGTPTELFTRGGDCEDFAIAKFLLLRSLGVPASSMRIVVMGASAWGPEHAVLVVRRGGRAVVLDNQRSTVYGLGASILSRTTYAFNDRELWYKTETTRSAPAAW